MYKILICDDEKDIVSALKIYLTAEGYECYTAYNGREAVDVVKNLDVHLVLLDIMMPTLDGVSALAEIRQLSNIPVIFLTAKSEDTDKILGLNVGADDYVTKPFNPVELIARVKSALRRYFSLGGSVIKNTDFKIGGIILDDDAKKVTVDGEGVSLTPREYEILKFLMQNKGKVFSPKEIYKNVWDEQPIGAENTVAVHIRHIREKIEIDPQNPRYLKVVWGQGYKMTEGM
jgi:DNA-binding response OmpR family regulator